MTGHETRHDITVTDPVCGMTVDPTAGGPYVE